MAGYVLIESDWNLNQFCHFLIVHRKAVLIESDWNLNGLSRNTLQVRISVLIESDWNLNLRYELQNFIISHSINRIRLEFKFYALDCRRGDSLKY